MQELDSIVALATPNGESALAVVRASGPLVPRFAARCNRDRPPLPRKVWHGNFVAGNGAIRDDVVYTYFAAPRSYTGEDSLEISCHGNPLIVREIVRDLCSQGFRLAEPGEFTKRAFLNGKLDLTEAEAVMDLITAQSERALAAARRQLQGALRQRIDGHINRLLDLCAEVEAHVDFPEEDLPEADRQSWTEHLKILANEFRNLAATRRQGDLVRQGVKVVLAGEPNAGKSSLLNRLVGFDRAIVSPEAGTTRDFLEVSMDLAGHHIKIFDTAGLRETSGGVERAGVEHTRELLQTADVVILVADGTAEMPRFSPDVTTLLSNDNVLVVANKSDLGVCQWCFPVPSSAQPIRVSALQNLGVGELRSALSSFVVRLSETSSTAEGMIINARHEHCLDEAAQCVDRAIGILDTGTRIDLAAVDIRAGIDAMSAIVGKLDHELVLDRIFTAFCIGK